MTLQKDMILRVEGMPTGERGSSEAVVCEGKCVPSSYTVSVPINGVGQEEGKQTTP